MAEHNLSGPVLGVSLDGTGYGIDGKIWGGEFLLCEGGVFERVAHLRTLPMIGGDASMKDAAKSAWCLVHALDGDTPPPEPAADETAPDLTEIFRFARMQGTLGDPKTGDVYGRALAAGINVIGSSSMGRWFDAVSALLGICAYNTYEGQCAMLLEDAAARALGGSDHPADCLALSFHRQVARLILDECVKIRASRGTTQVALTGGVFQNRILMEETLALLRAEGFSPYYNISVSPNDGGIALGQAYIASHLMNQNNHTNLNTKE
jgi:hydrogenase maturation protein HypF